MPRPPSDVFRPRLPLDPFAAVDVRAPWLVPQSLPHSPSQVILILGEPSPSELLPLLTSPHLSRSLLLLASHAPPPLPFLPPTTPGPAVRILRLAAPLAVQDAGALRLVALLEKAHRVVIRWRLALAAVSSLSPSPASSPGAAQLASSSASWGTGPRKARGATPAWPGWAADRVVQLAEAIKTGEFTVVESVVYLRPPSGRAAAAAATGSSSPLTRGPSSAAADPRRSYSSNNSHGGHHAHGPSPPPSGAGNPVRPSLSPLLTHNAPQNHHHAPRYPSPAPSVDESLSSSASHALLGPQPKKDGSASKNKKRFSAFSLAPSSSQDVSPPPSPGRPSSSYSISSSSKKLRKSMRSTSSTTSLSLSLSPTTSADISPFATSVKDFNGKDVIDAGETRAFDAILNFLPVNVPDKQLLKHAILVTTLGARYLEGDATAASEQHGNGNLGKGAAELDPRTAQARRFSSAFSVFSFGGGSASEASSPASSLPTTPSGTVRSTPDLLAFAGASASSARSRPGSAHSLALVQQYGRAPRSSISQRRPQSSYSVNGDEDTEAETEVGADTEADTEVEMLGKLETKKKKKSVRRRISAFLGGKEDPGGADAAPRRPDMVRYGTRSGSSVYGGVEGEFGRDEERGKGKAPMKRPGASEILTAHVVHILPIGWVDWEDYPYPPSASRRNSSSVASGSGSGVGMTAVAERGAAAQAKPKLVQSVEQFLLSFAYPLGSLGAVAGSGPSSTSRSLKEKEKEKESGRPVRPPPSAYPGGSSRSSSGDQHQNANAHEGRLAALAKQHRPVPYLVAPGVFGAAIPHSAAVSASSPSGLVAGARPLTHGEAILLGALDVDPASGSCAGTGRAWVGMGDVRVLGGQLVPPVPPVPAARVVDAVPLEAVGTAMLIPSSSSASSSALPSRSQSLEQPIEPLSSEKKKMLQQPEHMSRSRSDVQLPTPPESGSSSGESVEGDDREDEEADEPTERQEVQPALQTPALERTHSDDTPSSSTPPSDAQPQPQPQQALDTTPAPLLQRRPTRNHRPAPPPPSVTSPVREALESLKLSPTDIEPPPRVIAIPVQAAAKGDIGAVDLAAFPATKDVVGLEEEGEEGRPARPRTVHMSDAHRAAPPVVVNLNKSASQSTSALIHLSGSSAKAVAKEREREKNGQSKGHAHGLQAVWRRIAVWRGREKSAQKASGH